MEDVARGRANGVKAADGHNEVLAAVAREAVTVELVAINFEPDGTLNHQIHGARIVRNNHLLIDVKTEPHQTGAGKALGQRMTPVA